jgi:hypothetical protein
MGCAKDALLAMYVSMRLSVCGIVKNLKSKIKKKEVKIDSSAKADSIVFTFYFLLLSVPQQARSFYQKINVIAPEYYITSYVIIRNGNILRNEKIVFTSPHEGSEFLREAYEDGLKINYPRFYKMDELGKSGIIAADELLKEFDFKKYLPEEIGIVLSNKNASIEADIHYFETIQNFPSPALFVYTLPNIVIGEISIRYNFKGENAFFVSDRFDVEWIYFYVNDLIQHQKIKTCVCGWIEVVNGDPDVCLFLVETETNENALTFTPENLNKIYSLKSEQLK